MTPAVPAAAVTAVSALEALGAELGRLGWPARLLAAAGQPPALRVANPVAARLADDIRAVPAGPGESCYRWSWGDPVAAAGPAEAAALISRALRAGP